MKRFPSLPAAAVLFATALLLMPATANDQIREVQAALKTQGFYYGEVTGTENPETTAAIRRYQIRNGITVTGKLNADTLAGLGLAEKRTAAAAPQPVPGPAPQPAPAAARGTPAERQVNPPPTVQQTMPKPGEPVAPLKNGRALPPENEPAEIAQTPPRRVVPNDASVVEPPTPMPAPISTRLTIMFRDTPYAAATPEVQAGIIRRAQAVLTARHVYRGPMDGVAGTATAEAIFLFQEETELRRTGRLDTDTLAEMELLPQPARGNPLLKPFYNPNRHRDRSVLAE